MPLTIKEIDRLVENRHMADFFEEIIKKYKELYIVEKREEEIGDDK